MNRAMRRMNARQAAMRGRPAAPQLIPMTDIARWERRPDGSIETHRRAEFWRRLPGPDRRVACSLCYRRCEIADGEAGWCTFRHNAGGRLAIPEHGVTSMGWPDPIGYTGGGPWFLYRAGAWYLSLGGIRCTARCSFCSSAEIVWDPDRLPWVGGEPGSVGTAGGWGAARAILHPAAALQAAREWSCDGVLFGINEPTLDFEFTYDVARVMKRAGLRAIMNTNGFTTPERSP